MKTEQEIEAEINSELQKVWTQNDLIIKSCGKDAPKWFDKMMDGCSIYDCIGIVEKPSGKAQHENYGIFKDIHVSQWSVGMDGDSFQGILYAKVKIEGQIKWLSIPYSC